MSGSPRPLFLICAAALLPVILAARPPAAPQPPLPEPDSPLPSKPFELVPRRQVEGEQPPELLPEGPPPAESAGEGYYDPATDPIRDTPDSTVEPAPDMGNMEQLQEIDAPGAPSDGEPMPEIPTVPGLVIPKFRTSSPAGKNPAATLPGQASTPGQETSPALLPVPEFQLAAKAKWNRSPYQAFTAAKEEGKPILVFFAQLLNGAGPTAHINDDLFALPEFNEFASARLVLTKLQYPTGSPGKNYTDEKLAVLNMVKERFKVRGFPTLILLDDKGHELERISGYTRVKDNKGVIYSSAHTILDRLKEAEKRFSQRRQYRQDRVAGLMAQGYRVWYSVQGTSLLAKMVRVDQQQVVLMDEKGAWRAVRMVDLKLYDAEWARRKQAGLIEDPEPRAETVALDLPSKP